MGTVQNDLKFLKFLHSHNIIDINNYDDAHHCIFDFIKINDSQSKEFIEFFIENLSNISTLKYKSKSVLEYLQDLEHLDLQEKLINKIKQEFIDSANQENHLDLLSRNNCTKELVALMELEEKSPFIDVNLKEKIKQLVSSRPDFSISKPSGAEVEKNTKGLEK